nr:pleckstrin homology domain-containing family A member 7-like [Oncorhynchus nerka]
MGLNGHTPQDLGLVEGTQLRQGTKPSENPISLVVVRGWLYKQDSSGMRLWKRKWFVLSDYCLFYYKDSREETVLGSIPLPSYVIAPVEPDDHISRKYAFKAEHGGMRTYFFSADTQEDMNGWIRAMNQAALMQSQGIKRLVPPFHPAGHS